MRTQIRHIMWRLIRVYIVCLTEFPSQVGVVGWCDGPGRRTVWMIVGQGPVALALVAGGGCLDILLSSVLSLLFIPLSGRRPDID